MMDSMKKAIMKRRSKFAMPESDMGMNEAEQQEELDDDGETGLAPQREGEDQESIEIEEGGEDKVLSSPEEDVLADDMGERMPDMEGMADVKTESGLSPEEIQAIANDLMRGMNKDKPSLLSKMAMKMKGSLK